MLKSALIQPTYLVHFSGRLSGQYANWYERDKGRMDSPATAMAERVALVTPEELMEGDQIASCAAHGDYEDPVRAGSHR